ncbi:MAG: flagellar FlbD family protein [Acidimicrobiales bacterium]
MIQLTRLNNDAFALNTDLIERVDATPDTVVTLIDGTKYIVAEPLDEVIDRVVAFRARVVAAAENGAVLPLRLVNPDTDQDD